MTCENSVDENTIANGAVSADESENSLKEKYSRLYSIYLDYGYDLLVRDYGVDEPRKEFFDNCSKYVDECPSRGRRKENVRIFTNMYREYVKHGYDGVVKKFAYNGTRDALRSRFITTVAEYDGKARLREIDKDRVKYYSKVYEECKNNGIESAVAKFNCSNSAKFLAKQFTRYLKNYIPIKGFLSKSNKKEYEDKKIESKFWKDFDFNLATPESMKTYIIEHSDCKNVGNIERQIHYTVYLIVNRKNGKLYIGQHQTDNLDDGYMGSGKILELAKNKYGVENFEKIILFDFDNFEDMNDMEIDMISDEFLKKRDFIYNRCNGGFNGPNSEFQKEMYRRGEWKNANEGKVVCHNIDGELRYFFEDEIPEGWVKGGNKDEKLHREIDSLMDELRSLGSNYTWRMGDTVEVLKNHIEQFKKAKAEEERRNILWHEIFDFYKNEGRNKTVEKYENVDGIISMDRNFEKYVKEEFDEYKRQRGNSEQSRHDDIERMKSELYSYGIRRRWDVYSYKGIKRLYDAFLKRKAKVDEKIAYYSPIMDRCFEIGMRKVMLECGDVNLHHKLLRFLPLRYKEYMKVKYNKDIIVEENVYAATAINMGKYRKKREHSEAELKRIAVNHEERVRLFNELVALGSKVKYREDMALTTLRRSIEQAKIVKAKNDEMIKGYNDFYRDIMSIGYKEACVKRNYTGTMGNLKKRFMKYVPEFKYGDFVSKS